MKVVTIEEGQPINAFLLVRSQRSFYGYRNLKRLHFLRVQHLCHELAFTLTTLQKFFGETWRVWNTSFQWYQLHQRRKGGCGNEPNLAIRVAHSTEHWHDQEDDIWQDAVFHRVNDVIDAFDDALTACNVVSIVDGW